jgi:ribosomal protein L11 methyltransferase
MAILELKAGIPLAAVEPIEELLGELEEQRLMVLEDKPTARAWLMGYFESREQAQTAWKRLRGASPGGWFSGEPEIGELRDTDWRNSYRAHFKAWKFGRLHWVPEWERAGFVLPAGEEVLWLDPGMAFGTGNHETTRLVVERLVDFACMHGVKGRVIDAGCGSGILALSAAKLGFRKVMAFDNDPLAIEVSRENAERNGLGGCVEFFTGDLLAGLTGSRGELLLANIQADVLVRFARELCAAVTQGGQLVLSGILSHELEAVRAPFAAVAVDWRMESRALGEWADLVLTRPAGR